MRKFLLFIVVLTLANALFALQTDYRLSFRAGAIMPDGKVDKVVNQPNQWIAPTLSGEFAVTFHPEWKALRQWNNAGIGVALSYWNLGHNDLLGHGIAPYVFMDVPLFQSPHFILGIRPGIGCSFQTKTYYNTVPEGHLYKDVENSNQSIGSVFNFYFPEALYLEFPIRKGWSLIADGGWYHISNGSLRQPNSGYNIFAGGIGLRYSPLHDLPATPLYSSTDARSKKWELELAITAGGRQVYYRDQQSFLTGSMQLAAYWRAHNIFRLGGGVDVFYDGAYIPRETKFGKTNLSAADPSGKDCWRVGVSLQPEFVIGHLTAGFHAGIYLFDPVKNLEPASEARLSETGRLDKGIFYSYDLLKAGSAGYPDGWLYTQVVLRYHLPWHIFVQGQMKAHLTKVEFVALGLGAWL